MNQEPLYLSNGEWVLVRNASRAGIMVNAIVGSVVVMALLLVPLAMVLRPGVIFANVAVATALLTLAYAVVLVAYAIPAAKKAVSLYSRREEYLLTNKSLIVIKAPGRARGQGPGSREATIIPLREVKEVSCSQDFWERLLGCGTLNLETADGASHRLGPLSRFGEFRERLLRERLFAQS